MLFIFFISVVAFYFSILDSKGKSDNGLKYAFIILGIVAAIRYNYGGDYMSYMEEFKKVGEYSFSEIIFLQEKLQFVDAAFKDIGAALLYRLFKPLGFLTFSAVISIGETLIFYQFIKENVERKYYWFAVYVYLFQFDHYVLPMSMIRQGLTIALFVWSWHFLKERKILIPILIGLVSVTIHKSAVITLPFIFLRLVPMRNGKVVAMVLGAVLLFFFLSSGFVGNLYNSVIDNEFMEIYAKSYEDDAIVALGVIRKILVFVPFIVALIFLLKVRNDEKITYLVILSTIGTLIVPFTFVVMMISRLGYYFNIFMVATIPLTFSAIKKPILRYGLTSLIMISLIYQYFDIFLNSVFTKSFATYHSIFSLLL